MTDQRYSCQVCPRDDLSLTKNGRVRSHAANGRKTGPDNPACGGGSDYPIESTAHHTHVFEYGDDGMGHSGSFCTVADCGMAEPDDPQGMATADLGDSDATGPGVPQDFSTDLSAPTPGDASSLAGPDDRRPTASDYREASAILRQESPGADLQWAQDVRDRAVTHGVRADDPEGVCTCAGKKGSDDTHNAACVRFVPAASVIGPNRHRAPLPTSQKAAEELPAAPMSRAPLSPRETADAAAEAFLGGGGDVSPMAADAAAGAFLAEPEEEAEEDRSPRWFNARYDGSCGSCGERFLEGDRIARDPDGSGDWIAEECCGHIADDDGENEVERLDPMARLKARLPVRNGRYEAPDPEAKPGTLPKKRKFTRVTTFVKLASDSFALSLWSQRMAILGLVHRPELGRKVRTLLENADEPPYIIAKTERDRLNNLVDQAKEAAGHKVRAAKGTILHTHTEKLDRGEQAPGDVPEEFRPDAVAYLDAVERFGLLSHAHLVERSTVVAEMEVVGTLDRAYEITRRITGTLPGKGKKPGRTVTLEPGEFVIGDVKSGADLSYGEMEIATQLSLYSRGVNRHGIATPVVTEDRRGYEWAWRKPGESAMDGTDWVIPSVREDVGVVVHIPYGEHKATVYLVDLEEGWENAQVCLAVQERQRTKRIFSALPASAVEGAPARDLSMPSASQMTGHPSVTGRINGQTSAEAAAGAENLAATAKASAPTITTWAERFARAATRDEIKDVGVAATKAGMPTHVLEAFLWDALKRFPEKSAPAATPSWADRFAAVMTFQELEALCQEAQASGMPGERLGDLTKSVVERLPPAQPAPARTWAQRFEAARTMEALKDQCRQAQAAGMPTDRILEHFTRNKERIEKGA